MSYSRVPQLIAAGHREKNGDRLIASYAGGPIVFPTKSYDGTKSSQSWQGNGRGIQYTGDVRMGCVSDSLAWIQPNQMRTHFPSWRSCLTVTDGGKLVLTNQSRAFTIARTAFRVSKGGTMTFKAGAGATYEWTGKPASLVVDGTLTIGPALKGGQDQVYRGSGTLNLTGGATPASASSRVKFADALTVKLNSNWSTAVSGSESLALALGVTAGAPTLRVPTAWAYGAASGVTATSTADARAFALENGATAVLDPQGGTATLNEAVSGEGTLAITNGTLALNAASTASGATVAASGDAALLINADQRLAALALATGAVATVTSDVTLDRLAAAGATVDLGAERTLNLTGDVNVQDIEFAFDLTGGRRTLVRAAGTITGTPAKADLHHYRTKVVGGVTLLQVGDQGLSIILR